MAAKPKILVVDDDEGMRSFVVGAFREFECETFEAGNGVEGLALASREKPDIVVLDLTMPVMDGAEMLSKTRANPELKDMPVLVLTGHAQRENVLKIAQMGARDYILKPFTPGFLVERVNRVIGLQQRGETLAQPKRFDDPLVILVVDDKPAIQHRIKSGLAETNWTIESCAQIEDAARYCDATVPDAILLSLSLSDSAAFSWFQRLRADVRTSRIPVFGLCVKNAVNDQNRARQGGFNGVITKPIIMEDVKATISRGLNLDTSCKYFEERDGVLALKLPFLFTPDVAAEIMNHLQTKILEAVDSGLEGIVIDLSELKHVDAGVINLALNAIQLSRELTIEHRIIGSGLVCQESRNFEETKDWKFVTSFAEALEALKAPAAEP